MDTGAYFSCSCCLRVGRRVQPHKRVISLMHVTRVMGGGKAMLWWLKRVEIEMMRWSDRRRTEAFRWFGWSGEGRYFWAIVILRRHNLLFFSVLPSCCHVLPRTRQYNRVSPSHLAILPSLAKWLGNIAKKYCWVLPRVAKWPGNIAESCQVTWQYWRSGKNVDWLQFCISWSGAELRWLPFSVPQWPRHQKVWLNWKWFWKCLD
jgi:hypothetical protein